MGRWMFSVCIMVVEAWGNVYFFDTFLGRKKGIFFCRYRFPAYLAMMFAASTAGYWIDMWKLPVYILGYILLGRVCYQAGWIQGIYFSMLNYSMIFLTDLMLVSLMDLWETQEAIWGIWSVPGALFAKACWIVFIFLFRRVWKEGADYGELTDGEWLKLGLMPLFTLSSIVLTFFRCKEQPELRQICVFLSTGLVMVNFLVIWLLREILERGKKIRMGTESARKTEDQLAHYRDMQAVYERQGRKMHDYKNQIRTMQVLLKKGDTQAAAAPIRLHAAAIHTPRRKDIALEPTAVAMAPGASVQPLTKMTANTSKTVSPRTGCARAWDKTSVNRIRPPPVHTL